MATIKRIWEQSSAIRTKVISGLSDDIERLYTRCEINLVGVYKDQLVTLIVKTIIDGNEKIIFSDEFNLSEGQKRKVGPFLLNRKCRISIEGQMSGHFYRWGDCRIESVLCYDETDMKTLRVGVFFDGTGNNAYNSQSNTDTSCPNDEYKLSKYLTTESSIIPQSYSISKNLSKITCKTNVWKLHESFCQGRVSENLLQIKTYVEGIGTVRGQDDSLFTMGTGWSIPLSHQTGVIAKTDDAVEQIKAIINSLQDDFDRVEFCVYGFSRGAAAARHFINRVKKQDPAILSVFPAKVASSLEVKLVGLFDTVASILVPEEFDFDVGDGNTGEVDITMEDAACNDVFHITAGHEARENFSLNHIGPNFAKELRFPGTHCDIGGGYEDSLREKFFLTQLEYSRCFKKTPIEESSCYKIAAEQKAELLSHPLWGEIYRESKIRVASSIVTENFLYDQYSSAVEIDRAEVSTGIDRVSFQVMRHYSARSGIAFEKLLHDSVEQIPNDLEPFLHAAMTKADDVFDGVGNADVLDELTPVLGAKYIHNSALWDEVPTTWEFEGKGIIDRMTFDLILVYRPCKGLRRREFDANGNVFVNPKKSFEKRECEVLGCQ